MLRTNSIRSRLTFAAFSLATLVAGLFSFGLYLAFDTAEDKLYDDHILADVDAFMLAYEREPGIADIPQRNFTLHVASGTDTSHLPVYLRDLEPDTEDVFIGDVEYELHTRTLGAKSFYFLFDESEFEEFENAILMTMFVIVFIVIAGSTWAGHVIADRIIHPLTQLSRAVDAMGKGDGTSLALPRYADQDDEITHLALAINGYDERIRELLRREHEFSADVSHELRTPIMAVQGATELLDKHSKDERTRQLVTRIKRGCFHMTTLTEALLYLARDPASFEDMVEPVSVKRVIDAQIAAVKDVVDKKGIVVHVNETADTTINTIPAVIEIVIGNILKNAVKYTDQKVINIFVDNDEVVIQDYGPGIDRSVQATLFDRFNRGQNRNSDGSGIGLALVRRFCEQYGWGIDFRSDRESGTRVAVVF